MQRSILILAVLGIGLATPASAQDSTTDAKKACDQMFVLAGAGDAAKLANNFYTEKAVFIGPAPTGILVGREAIQKSYAEGYKFFKEFSGSCENAIALNESTVVVSGHWMGTPRDPNRTAIKGSYGTTFVKEGGQWLAALDSWNVDPPPPPTKSQ